MNPTRMFGPVTGAPDSAMRPSLGRSSPATRFSTVLFPHPDGPTMATNSPWPMAKDRSSTAVKEGPPRVPKRFVTASKARTGGAGATRWLSATGRSACVAL